MSKKSKKKNRSKTAQTVQANTKIKEGFEELARSEGIRNAPLIEHRGWGRAQIGRESYFFLIVCVVAQLATVLITWSAWAVRENPVNIPWVGGTPQFSCGILILISLAAVLVSPRRMGMPFHLLVMFAAISMDQFRCQPQILAIMIMMSACVWPSLRQLCVWYLVSMWLWAGIHKLVSPDWFGNVTVHILGLLQVESVRQNYWWFALIIAVSEILVGVICIAKPRIGALGCVALHLGITSFIILIYWNYSVIPWNLCTAIVGAWLLLKVPAKQSWLELPKLKYQWAIVFAMLIVPAGVYFGWVRNSFAHVLYSGNLPNAAITRLNGEIEPLEGWDEMGLPFPHETKSFVDFFQLSGQPGEKLHILEYRTGLKSQFFQMTDQRQLQKLAKQDFFGGKIRGIAYDNLRSICQLELAQSRMLTRSAESMVYAIEFDTKYFKPELLDTLAGLPNLEQIQLRGCNLQDSDLKKLRDLPRLLGVGLNETNISREGLANLVGVPNLTLIEFKGQIYRSLRNAIDGIAEEQVDQ